MKKYIFFFALLLVHFGGKAQELTTPQVDGFKSGTSMSVSFPFNIKGVPFSQIPASVWHPFGNVVVKLQMTYYMEGDPVLYLNDVVESMSLNNKEGSWASTNLKLEARPYPIPGVRKVDGKTNYTLSIYQTFGGKSSLIWNAKVNRIYIKKTIKVNVDKPGPKVVKPKDKVILNPQPIPPERVKKNSKKIIIGQ